MNVATARSAPFIPLATTQKDHLIAFAIQAFTRMVLNAPVL